MGISDLLKQAGYTPEKSTIGDKPIMKGIYKAMFVDWKVQEDKGYGESIRADFKITEKLSGSDSHSQFPEFVGFFNTSAEKINSKKNGLAKLLNGFFSVGINVDSSTDEALASSLNEKKGSAEVYIKGYKKDPKMKDSEGNWVDNPDGSPKQDFCFLTFSNAKKEAEKEIKKQGHPL
jgi:hypothetical protein